MWYAKPSGPYSINSDEAANNMFEMYNLLHDEFTDEAIAGILGNIGAEGGYNPWRWQYDKYNPKNGYGLVQFTPASGYIDEYGKGLIGYSPNLSVTGKTPGATPEDGKAQTYVIKHDRAGKYLDRRSWCHYYDLSNTYPFSKYKQITDIEEATIAWLFNYEAPADRGQDVAQYRVGLANTCYTIITGNPPPTPTPTPTPPSPTPAPPVPIGGRKLPLMYYLRRV